MRGVYPVPHHPRQMVSGSIGASVRIGVAAGGEEDAAGLDGPPIIQRDDE